MAFDGIVISNLVYELKQNLLNAHISKIAQPEQDELLLTCKGKNGQFRLAISANASLPFVYLTKENKKMIKSMTGFGRCEVVDEKRKFAVELKSVNHRYFDVNIKMPKKLNFFESSIRNLLKEYIERGKVDVFITYEDYTEDNFTLKYNATLAGEYLKYLNEMSEQFGLDNDIRVSSLSRYPDVFTMEEQALDEKELWEGLEKALRGACVQFVESRKKEGENLKADLISKLKNMLTYVDFIEERSPQIMKD